MEFSLVLVAVMKPGLITELMMDYLILKIEALCPIETSLTTRRHGITSQKAKVFILWPSFPVCTAYIRLGQDSRAALNNNSVMNLQLVNTCWKLSLLRS
jgi:hypothetical protein